MRPPPRAHPRVGGENAHLVRSVVRACGSSPRGRGKLARQRPVSGEVWLIPAWAGKTLSATSSQCVDWAHPRVGGENGLRSRLDLAPVGSSPRGRGKLGHLIGRGKFWRLIPAWAGKTRSRTGLRGCWAAHPRVGGENSPKCRMWVTSGGSSPRGRGKRTVPLPHLGGAGLIPAWAGKTR